MKKIYGLRAHMQKRLFILLMVSAVFSACKENDEMGSSYSILFYDLDSYETIANVSVKGIYDKENYVSDEKGFLKVPSQLSRENSLHVSLSFRKEGYVNAERRFEHHFRSNEGSSLVELIGMRKGKADAPCNNCFLATMVSPTASNTSYQDAIAFLDSHTKQLSLVR
jgi:hypothetical protein